MKDKKSNAKYWENEEGETIIFGNSFMRFYEKAGKLQFGTVTQNKDGENNFFVKFVLDKKELLGSDEGIDYLMQTLEDWKNEND